MSKTLYVKTLSPVFIGSGAAMEPFEYLFDQNERMLYRLAPDTVFDYILEKHPEAADRVQTWIEKSSQAINNETDNQRESKLRSEFTIPNFVRRELKNAQLANELEQQVKNGRLSLYALPCETLKGIERKKRSRNQTARLEEKQKAKKSVAIALKTAQHELYIPGSSLKGAIRTALLFKVVRDAEGEVLKELLKRVRELLDDERKANNLDRWKKEFDDGLEQYIFYCGIKDGRNQVRWDDAKCDLMKLISITDSDAKPIADAGRIAAVDLYQSNGQVQPQTPAVEAIANDQIFQVRFTLDTQFLLKAKELLENNDPHFGKTQWIGFQEKFDRLFGVRLADLTPNNVSEFEERVLKQILEASRLHSEAVRERESHVATRQKIAALETFYQSLGAIAPASPLKLGYASGFPGTTIFLAMTLKPQLRPLMQCILETFGIGKPQRSRADVRVELDRFPTSRRYETIINDTASTSPIGWIAISLEQQASLRRPLPRGTAVQTPPNPPSTVKAEIIDSQSKPPKVK
ncbi:MAG: type III-A CRISPR-associated RAMP protein Csm5, partial [Bacteroidota bacterium]